MSVVSTVFLNVCMTAALLAPLGENAATELRYRGTLTPSGRKSDGEPVKRFTIAAIYIPAASGGKIAFVVDEDGGGGWAWPERFGLIELDRSHKPITKTGIRLLHTHDGNQYPLSIRQPIFEFFTKLRDNEKWTLGKRKYEVIRQQKVNGVNCWRVQSSARIGRSETAWIDARQPLVRKLEKTIFMGRGDQFKLKLELIVEKPADALRLARLQQPLQILTALKSDLDRKPSVTKGELTVTQLNAATAALKTLGKRAESTPFSSLVATIRSDVEAQRKRVGSVAGLSKKFLGKVAPAFQLKSLSGKAVDAKDRAGKIVVLHFWEYQGKPLIEPYGQVGYLDFLNGKRRKLGVKVYGVAVDSRLKTARGTPAALRSIRKLQSFMNLSYDITLDDGKLVAKFGDPRAVDAKLPLWVVIDAKGIVRHYHTGFYKIRPDEGLRPLDAVLIRLIREARNK